VLLRALSEVSHRNRREHLPMSATRRQTVTASCDWRSMSSSKPPPELELHSAASSNCATRGGGWEVDWQSTCRCEKKLGLSCPCPPYAPCVFLKCSSAPRSQREAAARIKSPLAIEQKSCRGLMRACFSCRVELHYNTLSAHA
jgi:hypothetical protein